MLELNKALETTFERKKYIVYQRNNEKFNT